METLQLPPPPKSIVIQHWTRAVGIVLLGVAGLITSFTTVLALDSLRDSRTESECRSSLANATSRLEGEINARGWTAALELRGVNDPAKIEKRAAELKKLADEWRVAQERRNRADEICGE